MGKVTGRVLWAVEGMMVQAEVGTWVSDRYFIAAPQIWIDTQPELMPQMPATLPPALLAYLHLARYRLHLPQLYGFCLFNSKPITLLENVPFKAEGEQYPALKDQWFQTDTTRQLYWLWQVLKLWTPLEAEGVASSLLILNNLRVEGWCVRLRELYPDPARVRLSDLGNCWQQVLDGTHDCAGLEYICRQLQSGSASVEAIALQLYQLLQVQLAQTPPLHWQIAGATDGGTQFQNEDACFPSTQDLAQASALPYLAIVCDGFGSKEASQVAIRMLKLQVQSLFNQLVVQSEPPEPSAVLAQLATSVRIVNNFLVTQNQLRQMGNGPQQRQGTTLVLALFLPHSQDLYLAHVGDSRAYWLTAQHCYLLTADDVVTLREVTAGRRLYREALHHPHGEALTHALGLYPSEDLQLSLQHFILDEEGLLLLCTDGLSDRGLVEQVWQRLSSAVLNGVCSVSATVKALIQLANQKNGHDNVSVVLAACQWSDRHRQSSPDP